MVLMHDPDIGHRYVPNLKARVPNELGGSYVTTNRQGFRSVSDFVEPKGTRPRILFFGDSYTAGDLCSNEERFSDLVGSAFGAEVYNFGLSGSGTDQQFLTFRKYAKNIKADLIVIAVLAENIERNVVASRLSVERATGKKVMLPKPYFILEDGKLTLKGVPVPKVRPEAEGTEGDRFGSHRRDPRLKFAYQAVDFYRNDPRAKKARHVLDPLFGKLRPLALKAAGFQPFPAYKSETSEGWQLQNAILREWCSEIGDTPVLIVPLPTYHNIKDDVPAIYQSFFAALADPKQGRHVADVTTPLLKMPRPERLRIAFKEDVHFSPFGHEVVADLITREIETKGLLKQASRLAPAANPDSNATYVLGISGFYHNSAAALIKDGEIVAAAEEERFTRVKNDRRFPHSSINYCLEQAGISQKELSAVVYYDSAPLTFERLLHTQAFAGSKGADSWQRFLPSWALYKLHIPRLIRDYLKYEGKVLQEEHHRSHAASAFFASPFEEAAILTIDGVGEWATASIGVGEGNQIRLIKEMHFPDSLGLLYSAFTQFTGFKVNSGEYKMMGLAPYGKPKYVELIYDKLLSVKEDGSLELNLEYFSFLDENRMTNEKFAALFGGPARKTEDWISEREMDLAKSIQVVAEEIMLRMARHAKELTGKRYLCLAGGVALNCVANGRLLREGPFEDIFIQPAAGDSGGALGAALDAYHTYFGKPRHVREDGRSIQGASHLGPEFSADEIQAFLDSNGYPYEKLEPDARAAKLASLLAAGKVVGHAAGRLEFGPRALGSRSILGDARNQEMQVTLNLKIKYRESFRPFAPSVLEEDVSEFFEMSTRSPYMLLVAPVKKSRCIVVSERKEGESLTDVVKMPRSDVPAITHVDYSARVQTVNPVEHPVYYALIREFKNQTGYGVIVNTSFNVRGEPIVSTPYDSYRCFMRTEMDVLALENFVLYKKDQPPWPEPKGHEEFDTESKPAFDEKFMAEVAALFKQKFLPVAERLAAEHTLRIPKVRERSASLWRNHTPTLDVKAMFEIPKALDASTALDPEEAARAIVRDWSPNAAASALEAVVVDVLRLGKVYRASSELEEEVGDSVYVMF